MKIIKFLVIAMFIALLVNCAKKEEVKTYEQSEENGVKITKNNGMPADSMLQLNMKKVFSLDPQIDSLTMLVSPASIIEDKDQNIYILDWGAGDVKKYNSAGIFLNAIGRKGQGPGEFEHPAMIFLNSDTLSVYTHTGKISKFNLDGKFYYKKRINSLYHQYAELSPDGKKSAYYYFRMGVGENKDELRFGLSVLDLVEIKQTSQINYIQFTMSEFVKMKFDPINSRVPFSVGSNYVYLIDKTDSHYRFTAYDFEGEKRAEIRKSYRKIRFDESEKSEYIENVKKKPHAGEIVLPTHKDAIQDIYSDKYGRVLVIPSVDRNKDTEGKYIDIFKDGIFLNRVEYTLGDEDAIGALWETNGEVYFSGTRMYFVNSEDMSIDVYDY